MVLTYRTTTPYRNITETLTLKFLQLNIYYLCVSIFSQIVRNNGKSHATVSHEKD